MPAPLVHRKMATLCQLALVAAVALLAVLHPSALHAQTAEPPAEPTAGWDDGFFVQSADGSHRLGLAMTVQFDGRVALDDDAGMVDDTFGVRRFRAGLRGHVADRFDVALSMNFAGGSVTVLDAYMETGPPAFRLRLGRSRMPVGHERQMSIVRLAFAERALPTGLAPNRDVGIVVLGELAGGRLSYAGGIVNGAADGRSGNDDDNDAKDLVGRVAVRPSPGLTLALSGSIGRRDGLDAAPAYETTTLRQNFLAYDDVVATGYQRRYSPFIAYYSGSFGGYAELATSSLGVADGIGSATLTHRAWQVAGSWVLTGEPASESGVVPHADFNLDAGTWGAVQVAVRYHRLENTRADVFETFASGGSSRSASAWTAGLTWYLNRFLVGKLQFERTEFGPALSTRPAENALVLRTQLSF